MTYLAVLSQLLDLATYRPSNEVNPLILAAGPAAPVVKLLLIAVIVLTAYALGEHRVARRAVLGTAIVAGCVGAVSNL